jgi:hypothetical protein
LLFPRRTQAGNAHAADTYRRITAGRNPDLHGMDCGFEENADVVGAINILARGMKILRDEGQDTMDASLGCVSTARIACEVSDARGSSAAGTRRSGLGMAQCQIQAQ